MQAIIAPVATRVLVRELSRLSSLCRTRCAGNLVYDFMAHEAPEVMREVARLRELTYREAGGASGQSLDMDDFDTRGCYRQLIVWDPDHEQIVGGYRYCCCQHAEQMADGQPLLTSSHLFHYSDMFIADYLPYTMELGRAFVQPMYQHGAMGVKSLYALDNLWDGIGAVLYAHPQLRYLIGKVTVFPPYDALSRDLLYAYLSRYYADRQGLVVPKHPIGTDTAHQAMADELFADADAATALHCLQHTVRAHGCTLPPLFTAYLHLTNSMLYFGTARNDELSLSYETGLLIAVADIHPDKQKRYIHAN